jgi:hypothetical protein
MTSTAAMIPVVMFSPKLNPMLGSFDLPATRDCQLPHVAARAAIRTQ